METYTLNEADIDESRRTTALYQAVNIKQPTDTVTEVLEAARQIEAYLRGHDAKPEEN